MAHLDLAISLVILISGIGMTAVGIEMTINPPNAINKWWYRAIFLALGIVFVCSSRWQENRSDQRHTSEQVAHAQEQANYEAHLEYVQGQLDSMTKILGTLAANSSRQSLVAAIRAALPKTDSKSKDDLLVLSTETRIFGMDRKNQLLALLGKIPSYNARAFALMPFNSETAQIFKQQYSVEISDAIVRAARELGIDMSSPNDVSKVPEISSAVNACDAKQFDGDDDAVLKCSEQLHSLAERLP